MQARDRLFFVWYVLIFFMLDFAEFRAKAKVSKVSKLPLPADRKIEFQKDVLPIFERHCFQCHSDHQPKGNFNLKHRKTALKAGDHGAAIIVGESEKSPLIHYVAHLEEDMEMPPIGNEPLDPDQIAILRAWIDQGVDWETKGKYAFSPSLAYFRVSGNEAQFREQHWQSNNFSGGIDELSFSDRFSDGTGIELSARSLFEIERHQLQLRLEKVDLGFIEFGYDQFRRFYDDTGGYYSRLGFPTSLGKDLHLDVGGIWMNFGIDHPELPKIILGYEHQYRDGEKSMLHWGQTFSTDPSLLGKGIFPSSKKIDERSHIFKLDLSQNWRGWEIENAFQAEFGKIETSREMADFVISEKGFPESITRIDEDDDHFRGTNMIRAERQIKPWFMLSGGYLYSDIDAEAGFNLEGFLPSNSSIFPGDFSRIIILDRDSHVINFSSLLGPFKGLSAFFGVQNDWTTQFGEGDFFIFGSPSDLGSNFDQITTEENFGIRYTKLKNAVLHFDVKLKQREIGQREDQLIDDGFSDVNDFMRETDAEMDHKQFQAGMSYFPFRWMWFQTSFQRWIRQNQYDHEIDSDLGFTSNGNGYSAFIRDRDTATDEFRIRLSLRPLRQFQNIQTSFSYHISTMDFSIITDSFDFFGNIFPVGKNLSGNYDSHLYIGSISFQQARLHLSATATLNDMKTSSDINSELIVPYEGQVYTLLGTSNYTISKTLNWTMTYSFSRADFGQTDTGMNLPIGIDYDRHGMLTGLSKKVNDKSQVRLQYGFFTYDEPTIGGAADYTAHGIFASYRRSFR